MAVTLKKDAWADERGNLCESTDERVATSIGKAGGRPIPDAVAEKFGIKGNPDYDASVPAKGKKADVEGPPEDKSLKAPAEKKSGLTINK